MNKIFLLIYIVSLSNLAQSKSFSYKRDSITRPFKKVHYKDLIVKKTTDSIQCNIIRNNSKYITFYYNNFQQKTKSYLIKNDVSFIEPNFYPAPTIVKHIIIKKKDSLPKEKVIKKERKPKIISNDTIIIPKIVQTKPINLISTISNNGRPFNYIPFEERKDIDSLKTNATYHFGFNLGYSRKLFIPTTELNEEAITHIQKLQNGINISLESIYFFSDVYGIGIKEQLCLHQQTEANNKDSFTNNFLSPLFTIRNHIDKNTLFINLGLGCNFFNYHHTNFNNSVKIKDSSLASFFEIGYDFMVYKNYSFGTQINYTYDFKKNHLNENPNNLIITNNTKNNSSLNLSIGIKYNL